MIVALTEMFISVIVALKKPRELVEHSILATNTPPSLSARVTRQLVTVQSGRALWREAG